MHQVGQINSAINYVYTDRHEDADNIKDRVERYIPELMKLSLREAI